MICVMSRAGWCATRRKREPESYNDSQPTVCGYSIVMPWGYEERKPDCPACKKILRLEAQVARLKGEER